MTGNGTANTTNPPPDLISTEVNTMRKNNLVTSVGESNNVRNNERCTYTIGAG
jgi:hypothetical protein